MTDKAGYPQAAFGGEAIRDPMTAYITCTLCGEKMAAELGFGHRCATDNLKAEVNRLTALAVEYRITLEMIHRHDVSSFHGPEGKKHERAQWRGIMRRVRQVLAASMSDQHAEALRRLADK